MAIQILLAAVFTLIAGWSLIRISPGHGRRSAKLRARNPKLRASAPTSRPASFAEHL
jgi:hypothetical protein